MSLLTVREVTHRFTDGTYGLKNVDLALQEKDFLALAGPNGSGKTVLMRHLNGLLFPTEGEVLYRDKPVSQNLSLVRRKVGLVFQDADRQIIGQTVREDIAFGPANLGLPFDEIEEKVSDTAHLLGLTDLLEHCPYTLSGGEKRRLALAGILVMDPEIIILDEPFAGLDYPGVSSVLHEILKLHAAGHTIILISHDVEKVLAHVTRLAIMEEGKIVRDGNPAELLDDLGTYGIRRPPVSLEKMSWLK